MEDYRNFLTEKSNTFKSIVLNSRQLCDLELLLNDGFSPLKGFLNEKDYNSVLDNMRLSNGSLWPMPIVLKISNDRIEDMKHDKYLTLRDEQNNPLAIMSIDDIYKPDLEKECKKVFGTIDDNHPYVKIILSDPNVHYIGGELTKIQLPIHYDFQDIRLTPQETKKHFRKNDWNTVVGFQTRNPMHRSHMELTKYALKCSEDSNAKLLIHPVVGVTQTCDVDYHTRVRCYQKLISHYPENTVKLSLLPLSMRMGGPREALWHALIRQNYGCTHFCVGRDHAGPSSKTKLGNSFYGPYDAHLLLEKHEEELNINVIKSKWIVFVEDTQSYMRIDQVPEGMKVLNISGTEQRRRLRDDEEIPSWFSFPNIVEELRKSFKPKHKRGFCLYMVGLSGSGKSTLANAVKSKLQELESERSISVLDGDIIRHNLSKGLGFTKEDRSINVRRIGYVASEIVKHFGICLSANIAPYKDDRDHNRTMIEQFGNYIEIYVNTSLETCERRDVKGLYKLARQGKIKEFTGISDPFEEPVDCELTLKGEGNIDDNVTIIIDKLRELGLLK
jgi:sulfate adenylyltransferase